MSKKRAVKADKDDRPAGRPAGSKTQDLPQTGRVLSACPKCQDRQEPKVLQTLPVQEYKGVWQGVPYDRIHRRRVRCVNPSCRQVRIERTYE